MGRAPKVQDSEEDTSDEQQAFSPQASHNAQSKPRVTLRFNPKRAQEDATAGPAAENGRSLRTRQDGSAASAAAQQEFDMYYGQDLPQGRPRRGATTVEPWSNYSDPNALARSASSSRRAANASQNHDGSIDPQSLHLQHQPTLVPNSDGQPQDSDDLGGFGPASDPPPRKSQPLTKRKKKQPGSESEYGEEPDAEGSSDSAEETKQARKKKGSSDEEYNEPDAAGEDDSDDYEVQQSKYNPKPVATTSSGRPMRRGIIESDDSDDLEIANKGRRQATKARTSRNLSGFVDNDEDEDDGDLGYGERKPKAARDKRQANLAAMQQAARKKAGGRTTRNSAMATIMDESDDAYTPDEETVYTLRHRKNVSYAIPTLDQVNAADAAQAANAERAKAARGQGGRKSGGKLPLNMTGRQLDRMFGGRPIDSSDDEMGTPRKRAFTSGLLAGSAGAGNLFAGGGGSGGMLPGGTPNNLGKVGDAALADTDPLLPAVPVTFDQVGGMEQHVQQLKEMVQLPLLYPEVFQRFAITPPRGVLFHGPPGTGKTLLARALAASCSSEGQKISFFMRKGADCLSKWVGEAERQLRLLFEEAKAQQPSIIFFDEIDGLAPVRSSKQEQIHASIVSTLLALMDGMDGRGQVVVIGATNRPDSVDPALRRPGRFDREFYFPLPNREARRKIIDIHTKGWEPGLDNDFKDQLAQMTKGYGGADMRALCTEAALNAVQRTYPQIYKSVDRLLIKPEQISVSARDFVLSAKNMVPSTARSTSSVAAPLPAHLQPLLQAPLEGAKDALSKVLPDVRKVNILEEAEYVQSEGGFEHEQMLQAFEKMRVYRPRLIIHGEAGMGQNFIGPAILQHLEGFHVQSLDLGRLVSDSTRAAEAAVVEMFSEAKRHKPSIIYLPNLMLWASSVSDLVKATFKSLLDAMEPSEPILLMAMVDGLLKDVPFDIRSWFGFVKSNRVLLERPSAPQRREYFNETLENIRKTPKQFPDAVPKKKRKLAVLPKAPPLPPRQPTEAELARQMQNDATLREYLKFKLGPLIMDLKKRYKRFCRPIGDNYISPTAHAAPLPPVSDQNGLAPAPDGVAAVDPTLAIQNGSAPQVNGGQQHAMEVDQPETSQPAAVPTASTSTPIEGPVTNTGLAPQLAPTQEETVSAGDQAQAQAQVLPEGHQQPMKIRYVDVDLDVIHANIYRDVYLTTDAFLDDLRHIVNNSLLDPDEEQFARASAMLNLAIISIDQVADPNFKAECQQMAGREKARRKAARAKAKAQAAKVQTEAQRQEQGASEAGIAESGTTQERATLKRPAEDGTSDPAAKRVRIEDPAASLMSSSQNAPVQAASNGQQLPQPSRPLPPKSPLANGVFYGRERSGSPTPGASAPPATEESRDLAAGSTEMQTDDNAAEPEREATPEEPEPQEPDPPFVLPQEALSSLQHSLEFGTHDLNVDQLEQLRAALCDTIWRGRKDWDRTALVDELRELADEFLQECTEMKAAARAELE